jgi:hypothetical protein
MEKLPVAPKAKNAPPPTRALRVKDDPNRSQVWVGTISGEDPKIGDSHLFLTHQMLRRLSEDSPQNLTVFSLWKLVTVTNFMAPVLK